MFIVTDAEQDEAPEGRNVDIALLRSLNLKRIGNYKHHAPNGA
jgi:hypothetical protein